MSDPSDSAYFVAHEIYSLTQIETLWRDVAPTMSSITVFQSWEWLSAWLVSIKQKAKLLTFEQDSNVIGFCFIGESITTRKGVPFRVMWLNQTGVQACDQMWIEYNQVYCAEHNLEKCWRLLIDYFQTESSADVFELTNLTHIPPLLSSNVTNVMIESSQVHGYCVELERGFSEHENYISQLSKNTRNQVRRAFKQATLELGDIDLRLLSKKERTQHAPKLAALHKQRWANTPEGSGFANPIFIKFHDSLANDADGTLTEILRVSAGEHTLGYLYNLIYAGRVYFYLSAIDYQYVSNKLKSGFIMHTLAIAHYATKGIQCYDFLGGDAQYKQSLSTKTYTMQSVTVYKHTLKNKIFNLLKSFKGVISRAK